MCHGCEAIVLWKERRWCRTRGREGRGEIVGGKGVEGRRGVGGGREGESNGGRVWEGGGMDGEVSERGLGRRRWEGGGG